MLEFAMIRPTTPDDRTALMVIADVIGFQPKELDELSEMLADYFSGDSENAHFWLTDDDNFIVWHTLTDGLRRSDAHQPLEIFTDALETFRTAISYRFVRWLQENIDVFTASKASLGFI
jgi:hypothetical protein